MSSDFTAEQYLSRTLSWHLAEAARLEASGGSYDSDQATWALLKKQAITNHLLWALAKKDFLR